MLDMLIEEAMYLNQLKETEISLQDFERLQFYKIMLEFLNSNNKIFEELKAKSVKIPVTFKQFQEQNFLDVG